MVGGGGRLASAPDSRRRLNPPSGVAAHRGMGGLRFGRRIVDGQTGRIGVPHAERRHRLELALELGTVSGSMRIGRRAIISLLLAGATLLALSCGGQTDLSPSESISNPVSSLFTGNKVRSMKRPEVSYLDRIIPPCTVQFGNQDPCSDKPLAKVEMLSVNAAPPYLPPAYSWIGSPNINGFYAQRKSMGN